MNTPTAVVTGAAGGLGQATARQLLAAGFHVVAVTRDEPSARTTLRTLAAPAQVPAQVPVQAGTVHALHADLMDRAAIRALAAGLRDTVAQVDVLVNNAGAAFSHYAETADGMERTHALNHLAPFHLTHLLLADGLLAPDARIINISSDLVTRGRIEVEAPDVTGVSWRDRFSQIAVYGTAKLTGVLATTALATRLPTGMHVYSANPGVIRTAFNSKSGGLLKAASLASGLFAQTPEKAAGLPVRLAGAPTPLTPNGGFFTRKAAATPPEPARDADLAARVYEDTARVLGLVPLPTS
ncbi:SDR family NAD(P)-dependent oxidoreductase [Streptomyces sp. NPDC059517]|uniref:SDR family NAD(P)-dependent oxidoreductase n=1 Tax=Streptomyces sp. NPDC059517 TaxID=3346855 RepID=UPI0036752C39